MIMKEKKPTIEECIFAILDRMRNLQYKENTINSYELKYQRFLEYSQNQNEIYFSERLALNYLDEAIGIKLTDFANEQIFDRHKTIYLRMMRLLGQYHQDQTFNFRFSRYHKPVEQHEFWIPHYDAFMMELSTRDITTSTIRRKEIDIRFMIDYFIQKKINSENHISRQTMDELISTIITRSPKSFNHTVGNIRDFSRFLYNSQRFMINLENLIPSIKQPHHATIPLSWETEDVKKILNAIDRKNPVGKRDYAMILLACRLGLRATDIISLSLENINWEAKEIALNQNKTGNHLALPLLKDIGWALIDYLKNGRPETNCKEIFIRHNPPYNKLATSATLNRIFQKAIHSAGLSIPREKKCGVHSLRHTLGRILLENEVSLPVIAGILGHQTIKSTETYLKINTEGLFQCPLNPDDVFHDEDEEVEDAFL